MIYEHVRNRIVDGTGQVQHEVLAGGDAITGVAGRDSFIRRDSASRVVDSQL